MPDAPQAAVAPITDRVPSKVYFVRIDVGADRRTHAAHAFDSHAFSRHIQAVDKLHRFSRDGQGGDGIYCSRVDDHPVVKMLFHSWRYKVPPMDSLQVEAPEALNLANHEGLSEPSFVVFFADRVAGIIYDKHSPSPGTICKYLRENESIKPFFELHGLALPKFHLIMKADALARMRRQAYFRKVKISIKPNELEGVAPGRYPLLDSMRQLDQHARTDVLEVEMRVTKRGHPTDEDVQLTQALKDEVLAIAQDPLCLLGIKSLSVQGSATDEMINLFGNRLIYAEQVVEERSRTMGINPHGALDAIRRAYDANAAEIAASIQVDAENP